jgi:hypothetical protein
VPMNAHGGRAVQRRFRRADRLGVLLRRQRLPGQDRLVALQAVSLQQAQVGRDAPARVAAAPSSSARPSAASPTDI